MREKIFDLVYIEIRIWNHMIITKTPLRICLGGGGTDLREYYSQHEGFLVSAAINKFIYVIINRYKEGGLHLVRSHREIVHSLQEVFHPIAREVMDYMDIDDDIEILTVTDIPSGSGLGTSSSFTVGLIKALSALKKKPVSNYELAEIACEIERERLKEPGGKQDQYIAAFGGITWFEFKSDGSVVVSPLRISYESINILENNLLIFNLGTSRSSSSIQSKVISNLKKEKVLTDHLHGAKELGYKTKEALEEALVDDYGGIMHQQWNLKKNLSSGVSNSLIDSLYDLGISCGSSGGKVIGAGGGGYIMFYNSTGQQELREAMTQKNLKELQFGFDFGGSRIVVDEE